MILSAFDRAVCSARAGQLISAVDWAIAKAVDDGAFRGIRQRVSSVLAEGRR